jgi:YfiH family protein
MFQHQNFVFKRISHKFFNKQFLKSSHIYTFKPENNIEEVLRNHKHIIEELKVKSLKIVKQIHSNIVYTLSEENVKTHEIEADAIVTNKSNIALGILTADCVPILFADEKNSVIGIAHAGWKGAINNIIKNTIDAMVAIGANIHQIQALIGPCIHQESYEVGQEFYLNFISDNARNEAYFQVLSDRTKYLFDLKSFVRDNLSHVGVKTIYDIAHNTFAMPSLYTSYRRSTLTGEPYKGSLLSTIVINEHD